eukprot:Gregarina_sp_Poly_1__160@NODE_1036_length_5286_cov_103_904771_g714_i1_p1_GENE_NODE_1036_length_5286_cov_103_904771_g714_i1NODE_1036_length_5286_cov_103_904771_g714_i1_p1_ORF_typecomplete_len1331_score224_27Coatomer_WDAD/PF04053_14/1_2e02Coatomer_WDAD/PF04053_14/6_6e02Coatomer_WDAD/PF04053_14/2_3e87COPI_C/PF06957_11/5_8e61WD40/PF00400_32/5_7WD40/PF00400_32/1_7e07WD40/PF00400_32/9_3e10WD40/PF00400_32/1_9e09WD40/PF00400_32/6_6e08WD40/PF00400_32/1_1e09WD40/PF00400_32/1_1e04WD40/PF00400_32/93ANAPC4_W
MLVKCETKSQRVKGLAFHPRLSWILASLHNGVIQLWDYRLGCLIEKFEEHFGPVRGVDFHNTQPLFVSGGDDHKVKVWNYKMKKSVFTLSGHLDYIRTVQFHHDYPWICSAADDQTIRIWNWQSRHCLAVLAGHHHYVMCASFHPKEDLLASASLDQTIRLWELSGLREKTVSGTSTRGGGLVSHPSAVGSSEIFGATDAVCKFILEGHDRGVNWVSFHPTTNMIASGADDRLIKLWRYDESKWWEVDTLRGHFNNVSCVVFHPLKDIVVSNSEDRTIRVWDLSRRVLLHTYRRDNDRFWMLSAQTDSNLLAVGHDTGMVVFKLERERPAFYSWIHNGKIKSLHVKGASLKFQADCIRNASLSTVGTKASENQNSRPTYEVELASGIVRKQIDALSGCAHTLLKNPLNTSEVDLVFLYRNVNTGATDAKWSYDIHSLPLNLNSFGYDNSNPIGGVHLGSTRSESGTCNAFAFCARNRYVVLDASGQLYVQNISRAGGELRKHLELPPNLVPDGLFYAGNNRVLIRCEDTLVLYDVMTKKILGELNFALVHSPGQNGRVRQALWSPSGQHLALLSKHYVLITNSSLEHLTSAHECIRVKSGAWDEHGCFIYNTISHLKYLLPSGDTGIFQSIPEYGGGMYIEAVLKGHVVYLTRRSTMEKLKINTTEEALKIALSNNRLDIVASLLHHNPMRGNAWVGYLKRKGFQEVAYHCVSDPATKALLATEFADLDAAQEAVKSLNSTLGWKRLGETALKLGSVSVAERAFQKSRMYSRLIYLYTITGNFGKLNKLANVLKDLGDYSTSFQITLITGDIDMRAQLLMSQKQYTLAYVLAKRHGLEDLVGQIENHLQPQVRERLEMFLKSRESVEGRLFLPPIPVMSNDGNFDWPLTHAPTSVMQTSLKGGFDALMTSVRENKTVLNLHGELPQEGLIGADYSGELKPPAQQDGFFEIESEEAEAAIDTRAWGNEDDEDWFGSGDTDAGAKTSDTLPEGQDISDEVIIKGVPIKKRAMEKCAQLTVADHVACGHFKEAFGQLDKRIGLRNAKLLIPLYTAAYQAAQSVLPTLPLLIDIKLPLLGNQEGVISTTPRLHRLVTPPYMSTIIKDGSQAFSARKLDESKSLWKKLLLSVTLAYASSKEEEQQILEWLKLARNYVTVIDIEDKKSKILSDAAATDEAENEQTKVKEIRLTVLQTTCELQSAHKFLVLKEASRLAVKSKNYITGAALARKVIQGDFGAKIKSLAPEVEKIKRIIVQCEAKGTNASKIDIDAAASPEKLRFCSRDLELLEITDPEVICNFCGALSHGKYSGSPCNICDISELGRQVIGMSFRDIL